MYTCSALFYTPTLLYYMVFKARVDDLIRVLCKYLLLHMQDACTVSQTMVVTSDTRRQSDDEGL